VCHALVLFAWGIAVAWCQLQHFSAMGRCVTTALLAAAASPPAVILFGLGFASRGFTWVHGALFAAMIASTDALAATAILKAGE
jgi:NhaP-type Na+/H+ or K+/H+ antiporter